MASKSLRNVSQPVMRYKGLTFSGGSGSIASVELPQEFQLKLCKKIAQLTKVIVNLNTRNDENENIMSALQQTHEDELQRLVMETSIKVNRLKEHVESFQVQQNEMRKLRLLIEEQVNEKKDFLQEFNRYKCTTESKLSQIEQEYENKYLRLKTQYLEMHSDFQDRVQDFSNLKQKFENCKDTSLIELVSTHQKEMEAVSRDNQAQIASLKNEKAKVEEELKKAISVNENIRSLWEKEKQKLASDHETSFRNLKALYEKEIEVLKAPQNNITNSEILLLQNSEKQLRRNIMELEDIFNSKVKLLENELSVSQSSLQALERQHAGLKETCSQHIMALDLIRNELAVSSKAYQNEQEKSENLSIRLVAKEELCKNQDDELLRRAERQAFLEAKLIELNKCVDRKEDELAIAVSKSTDLQQQVDKLQKKLHSSAEQSGSIKRLEKELSVLQKEKANLEAAWSSKLQDLKEKSERRIRELSFSHESEQEELKRKHAENVDKFKKESEAILMECQDKLLKEFSAEKGGLLQSHAIQVSELEGRVKALVINCADLQARWASSEHNAGNTSQLMQTLQSELKKATEDLLTERQLTMSLQEKLTDCQDERKKLESRCRDLAEESQIELRDKTLALTRELDEKWLLKLREECARLSKELLGKHETENERALGKFHRLKEEEVSALRLGYESKLANAEESRKNAVVKLEKEISEVRQRLKLHEAESSKREADLRRAQEQQRSIYEEKLAEKSLALRDTTERSRREIDELKLEQQSALSQMADEHQRQMEALSKSIELKFEEQIVDMTKAHHLAIVSLRRQEDDRRGKELEALRNRMDEEKDALRKSLMARHVEQIEQVSSDYRKQLAEVKMEVERSNELRRKEFEVHTGKLEELLTEISSRKDELKKAQEGLTDACNQTQTLRKELESKVDEVLTIRREANLQLRKREDELKSRHRFEMKAQGDAYLKEKESLIHEYNRTIDQLQDNISAMQLMLQEADRRYESRESREEDIETINELRAALTERDLACRRLTEEKRYFQLELVNRETNFNKVFNATPNVGVMNPLDSSKGKKSKSNVARSTNLLLKQNRTGSPGRLEPLSHAPSTQLEQKLSQSSSLPGHGLR